ncbi:MAG: hypothetical protein ACI9J2_002468 [Saprospiraceae bacterium]|jgi:hypothetical protein
MLSSNGADEAALQFSYTDAPAINIATAEQLLLEAKGIMDSLGVRFFLRQGTCLGIIRNKALIPWDDDIDIGSLYGLDGVTDEKIEAVAAAFTANGYYAKVEDSDDCVGVTMMKSSTRIDWNCYKVTNGTTVHYPGVRMPAQLFENLKEIDFIGTIFFVPNPPEEYLRFKYGLDWMTPKKEGFEKDVLALISDAPASDGPILQEQAGKLKVLDHENQPVINADVRIVAVGSYQTDELGYVNFPLVKEDWYALVIKHGDHEEVLYQEKMTPGITYVYQPDQTAISGRLCVLSQEEEHEH